MICRGHGTEVEGLIVVMRFVKFQNDRPAIEAGIVAMGFGVEERHAVSRLGLPPVA